MAEPSSTSSSSRSSIRKLGSMTPTRLGKRLGDPAEKPQRSSSLPPSATLTVPVSGASSSSSSPYNTTTTPSTTRSYHRSSTIATMVGNGGGGGGALSSSTTTTTTTTSFMDSFRAVLEDFDETDSHHNHNHHHNHHPVEFPDDPLGAQITRILNSSPHFRALPTLQPRPQQPHSQEDLDYYEPCHNVDPMDYPTWRPLLSSRNWRWLQHQFRRFLSTMYTIIIKDNNLPFHKRVTVMACQLRDVVFLPTNTKSWMIGVTTFVTLALILFSCLALTITFATLWTTSWIMVVSTLSLSILIDFKEVIDTLPETLRSVLNSLVPCLLWIDLTLFAGKRFRGREWNKKDFEWKQQGGKAAPSFGRYLWSLPPPSIQKGKEKSTDWLYMVRDEWSMDTTKHVIAIDYCYIMLREAFLRKQFTKLRKATFQRNAITTGSLPNLHHSKTRKRSADLVTDDQINHLTETINDHLDLETKQLLNEKAKASNAMKSRQSLTLEDLKCHSPGTRAESMVELATLDGILDDVDDDDDTYDDGSHSATSSTANSTSINGMDGESVKNLNWVDVGAEIGKKILGSAAIQKAMTSHDTAERIVTIKENIGAKRAAHAARAMAHLHPTHEPDGGISPLSKPKGVLTTLPPVHAMWTHASAAAESVIISPSSTITPADPPEELLAQNVQIFEIPQGNTRSSFKENIRLSRQVHNKMDQERKVSHRQDKRAPDSVYGTIDKGLQPTYESIELVQGKGRRPSTPLEPKSTTSRKRAILMPGVKIAVPVFPVQPGSKINKAVHSLQFQMATVVSSKRLAIFQKNKLPPPGKRGSNCLSVTVQLDKSFLRNGKFAQLTFRVMDEWSDRYMPKHSKLPLGCCVATSFGLGVLVGWRVEDDCHVVRSLWQRRGSGSACAYLQRDAIHCTVEAAVGFDVDTTLGHGEVKAYVNGGKDFKSGTFLVEMKDDPKTSSPTRQIARRDVLTCKSARFIPVIEHVKEAVQYQLQVDSYNAALKGDNTAHEEWRERETWRSLSKYSDILWKSFLRATEEDQNFDEGMNEFIASVVSFFDRLDAPPGTLDSKGRDVSNIVITATESTHSSKASGHDHVEASWFMNDIFGLFGGKGPETEQERTESIEVECSPLINDKSIQKTYDRAFAVIRTLMRTVSIARAGCVDEPEFKLALSLCYEFLIFIKTVIKVQQKNISPQSLLVWRRAWEEIVSTFGPVKDRLEKIGQGIAERMEKQGRRAKVRVLRFVDTVVQDEVLLMSIEQGDWRRCGEQLEAALVKANIIDEQSQEHYHKTAQFIYNHFASIASKNGKAAARNNAKLAHLATAIQCIAAPRRSILRLLIEDNVLDALERVLVQVFDKEQVASQMLSIHASNFHSLRQFRMLKDFTVAGRFWMPLLEAADSEFSWLVSKMPSNVKEYVGPLSNLFSLCIVQFQKISEGDLTKDWLDFLLEEEAVQIIHDIDMKLILALESFSRDVKEMMVILPYYPSIEDDILNLVDEMDIDQFLKEASEAVDDPEKLSVFIREKATVAIERFLDYLPKLSIPVEKRDLADGWVLTCRGADGGDLTLTDLSIKRENLTCQVLGGDTLFFPMLSTCDDECKSEVSVPESSVIERAAPSPTAEASVLDHIREIILNAQQHGCWQQGVGGISHPPTDRYVASVLHGLPVSSVLNCGIELWRNLEIDDDELLEIAIRDVSYQIQIQGKEGGPTDEIPRPTVRQPILSRSSEGSEPFVHRFNPRIDPSVLYLEIQKLTFHLDKFLFRIEKDEKRRTVFDPVFEGSGSLLVRNVSIKLRVECVKEYVEHHMGRRRAIPLLQIRELDVQLEKVKLKVKDTGADWILNKVVKSFEDSITQILATNLNEQVREQMEMALENLNGYFAVNPELMLGLLDITIDDLEEKVVWV